MISETPYDCAEAFSRLDDYLDRELTPEEMRLVKGHLETCAMCAKEFNFEARVLQDARAKLQRVDIPDELKSRIFKALSASTG